MLPTVCLTSLPALPQAPSISFSYIAAPSVSGQHVCQMQEGAFSRLCLRGCHSSRPRLLRLCCVLYQCDYCYYDPSRTCARSWRVTASKRTLLSLFSVFLMGTSVSDISESPLPFRILREIDVLCVRLCALEPKY